MIGITKDLISLYFLIERSIYSVDITFADPIGDIYIFPGFLFSHFISMIDLIIYICSIVLLRIYIHNLKQGSLSLIHIEDLDESNDAIRSPRVYDTGSRKQEVQYIVIATVLCPLELLFLERRRRGRSFFFHVSSTVFVRWFLSRSAVSRVFSPCCRNSSLLVWKPVCSILSFFINAMTNS